MSERREREKKVLEGLQFSYSKNHKESRFYEKQTYEWDAAFKTTFKNGGEIYLRGYNELILIKSIP